MVVTITRQSANAGLVNNNTGSLGAARGLLRAGRWPVLTVGSQRGWPAGCRWMVRRRAASFLFAGDYQNISSEFLRVRAERGALWNSTARFLLVLQQPENHTVFLQWLLSIRVANVVVAFDFVGPYDPAEGRPALAELPHVLLFSTLPPHQDVCQRDVREVTLVDSWFPHNASFLHGKRDLFVWRRPENCKHCPVRAVRSKLSQVMQTTQV